MEFWIRNQRRTTLKIVSDIRLSVTGGNIFCDSEIFGEYRTKERALEVLNEIQKHIEKQGTSEAQVNEYGIMNGIEFYSNVYEMPKE